MPERDAVRMPERGAVRMPERDAVRMPEWGAVRMPERDAVRMLERDAAPEATLNTPFRAFPRALPPAPQQTARYNYLIQAREGLPPGAFPPDTRVYSGHYHLPHDVPGSTITYVGSPYQVCVPACCTRACVARAGVCASLA
eukprot:23813-Chlamydomonas_euryale.AAC.1